MDAGGDVVNIDMVACARASAHDLECMAILFYTETGGPGRGNNAVHFDFLGDFNEGRHGGVHDAQRGGKIEWEKEVRALFHIFSYIFCRRTVCCDPRAAT
eukprot:SAG31_NODE_1064_length_10098_cov_3.617462_4_plen_100_part_00